MSPRNLRIPVRKLNLRYAGIGAICAVINNSSIDGPQVYIYQTEEKTGNRSNSGSTGNNVEDLSLRDEPLAVKDTTHPSTRDSVAAAFSLHINALLESIPPCPLKNKLTHFMEHDWHDIEKILEGDKIDSVESIKSHWRQIESLVGDTNDIFLQEGALLLSLVLGESDLASEFDANVKGMEKFIMDMKRGVALPAEPKSLLLELKTRLRQCRNKINRIVKSGMEEDKISEALKTQHQKLFAQFKALETQIPHGRFQDMFKRHSYKCLMSLKECQRPPLSTPEIAAFSKSLRAIAANTGDFAFSDKLFHVIHTTLRDADQFPTHQIASLLAAQCNEILSQHGHLLSPILYGFVKAQGEAVFKRVSESALERLAFEKSVPFCDDPLAELVDKISDLVFKLWGTNVKKPSAAKGNSLAKPVTAFEFIADVNPALAGTMRGFLESVRVEFIGVPLKKPNAVALQRLLRTEFHIVDQLKRARKGAAKSEFETNVKKIFADHVNSLWPSVIEGLDSRVQTALNKKYAETFTTLDQTSTLGTLIRSVKKLTPDPRVLALCTYVVLSTFVGGAEGAAIPEKSKYSLVKLTPNDWKDFVCPILDRGMTEFHHWFCIDPSTHQKVVYACMDNMARAADKVLQVWKDYRGQTSCQSKTLKRELVWLTPGDTSDVNQDKDSYDLRCTEVMRKNFRNIEKEVSQHYCFTEALKDDAWKVQVSHHPNGPFTYCAGPTEDPEEIAPHINETDGMQYRQLQCRHRSKADLSKGIPHELVVSDAELTYEPPSRNAEGSLLLSGPDIGVWWKSCDEDKFERLEPPKSKQDVAPPRLEAYKPVTRSTPTETSSIQTTSAPVTQAASLTQSIPTEASFMETTPAQVTQAASLTQSIPTETSFMETTPAQVTQAASLRQSTPTQTSSIQTTTAQVTQAGALRQSTPTQTSFMETTPAQVTQAASLRQSTPTQTSSIQTTTAQVTQAASLTQSTPTQTSFMETTPAQVTQAASLRQSTPTQTSRVQTTTAQVTQAASLTQSIPTETSSIQTTTAQVTQAGALRQSTPTQTSFMETTTAQVTQSTMTKASLTQSTQPSNSSYILGPVSSTLPPGKHSAIDVDGVTYGLYEKTTSGIMPVRNETLGASTPSLPTSFNTPSPSPRPQPATLDFSHPIYPTLATSEATAVGHVAPYAIPWVSRLANAVWGQSVLESTMTVLPYAATASVVTAIAGAIYYQSIRRCDDTSNNGTVNLLRYDEQRPLYGIELVDLPPRSRAVEDVPLTASVTGSETATESDSNAGDAVSVRSWIAG